MQSLIQYVPQMIVKMFLNSICPLFERHLAQLTPRSPKDIGLISMKGGCNGGSGKWTNKKPFDFDTGF